MGLAGVFNRGVQQCCDCLVFTAAVFPHQGADADQMRDVGNRLAFSPLLAMQLFGSLQGFAVAGSGHHWFAVEPIGAFLHCQANPSARQPSVEGLRRSNASLS